VVPGARDGPAGRVEPAPGQGGRVLVVGRLDISHYQSRDSEPRVGFEVWADEVVNLVGRPAEGDRELVAAGARGQAPAEEPLDVEELPF
jgi:single-stranded DNA-binding protein